MQTSTQPDTEVLDGRLGITFVPLRAISYVYCDDFGITVHAGYGTRTPVRWLVPESLYVGSYRHYVNM